MHILPNRIMPFLELDRLWQKTIDKFNNEEGEPQVAVILNKLDNPGKDDNNPITRMMSAGQLPPTYVVIAVDHRGEEQEEHITLHEDLMKATSTALTYHNMLSNGNSIGELAETEEVPV